MPLDDTTRQHPKAKPAAKPDAHAAARAEFDRVLPELRLRAKTTKDKRALEYWASTEAERLDGAWREEAKAAAVKAGVLPDLELNPLEAGTAHTVYSSGLLTIGLKVDRRPARTNVDKMVAYLEKRNVSPSLLKLAVKRNTPKAGVANVYTALLVTG
jgi:hypothetical protein